MSEQTPLDDQTIGLLSQECDRMLTLYMEAQNGIQSVFNFYLTFATAVVGGLVLLFQVDTAQMATDERDLFISGLLVFTVIASTTYLSALAGRYAHAGRYAAALDALRKQLLSDIRVNLPLRYQRFVTATPPKARSRGWLHYIFPSGTYQLFIALISSTALALLMLVLAKQGQAFESGIPAAIVIFIVSLTLFNAYTRLVIQRFNAQINVYMGDDFPAWASRL